MADEKYRYEVVPLKDALGWGIIESPLDHLEGGYTAENCIVTGLDLFKIGRVCKSMIVLDHLNKLGMF